VTLAVVLVAVITASLAVVTGSPALAQPTDPPTSISATLYRVGGIGCDGSPQAEPAGQVIATDLGGSLRLDIDVNDTLYPSRAFIVEAWEEAPGCVPDDALVVSGAGLTTDPTGSGSKSVVLPLPYQRTFPDGSTVTLGDGQGTERLVEEHRVDH